jgi:protein subunit release factor B
MGVEESVLKRLRALGADPDDVRESFARAGGKGGQNVNKVSTGVTLSHPPSGVVVRCAETRSQARNRELAWQRLAETLERERDEKKRARRQAIQKEIRRKRPKPRRVKERILESKRRRSETKRGRSKIRKGDY